MKAIPKQHVRCSRPHDRPCLGLSRPHILYTDWAAGETLRRTTGERKSATTDAGIAPRRRGLEMNLHERVWRSGRALCRRSTVAQTLGTAFGIAALVFLITRSSKMFPILSRLLSRLLSRFADPSAKRHDLDRIRSHPDTRTNRASPFTNRTCVRPFLTR